MNASASTGIAPIAPRRVVPRGRRPETARRCRLALFLHFRRHRAVRRTLSLIPRVTKFLGTAPRLRQMDFEDPQQGICVAPPRPTEPPVCAPPTNYCSADSSAAPDHSASGGQMAVDSAGAASALHEYWSSMGAAPPSSTSASNTPPAPAAPQPISVAPPEPLTAPAPVAAPDAGGGLSGRILKTIEDGTLGFGFGAMQGILPGGFLAPSPEPRSRTHELFRGVGEAVSGAAEAFVGLGGEMLGFGLDATGGGAIAGVPINIASGALVANGGANAISGLGTLWHAMTEMDGDDPAPSPSRNSEPAQSSGEPRQSTPPPDPAPASSPAAEPSGDPLPEQTPAEPSSPSSAGTSSESPTRGAGPGTAQSGSAPTRYVPRGGARSFPVREGTMLSPEDWVRNEEAHLTEELEAEGHGQEQGQHGDLRRRVGAELERRASDQNLLPSVRERLLARARQLLRNTVSHGMQRGR
jgi:hypothetical protein